MIKTALLLSAATLANAPRAVMSDPRAQTDNNTKLINELATSFEDFKTRHIARIDSLEEEASVHARVRAAGGVSSRGERSFVPVEPEYTTTFASYLRRGGGDEEGALKTANATGERHAIQAAMSVGDNSAGGYLAPVEWDRLIRAAQRALSPMRRIAQVQTTGVAAFSTLWSNEQWGSGWVGETAARPDTTSPTFTPLTFAAGEIYANPSATQRLIDDADIEIDKWLIEQLDQEFTRQEGPAFLSGNGVNKPNGLLTYAVGGSNASTHPGGALDTVNSGHATTIPSPDTLMDFKYGLASPYRQNATWLMNSQTAVAIAKMKDGQGQYIWREGLADDQPTTLLGRPVEIDEGMPNIGAGNLPIAFGDFNAGYLINDRKGVRILRDPYTNKPYVSFYATKRVGGGVLDPRAIRVLKISA